MSGKVRESQFKPRARMLLQLGDQLIRNENIAISELVKNSYDADAKACKVIFNNIDSKEKGEIQILDDGIGMTPEVVKNVWLEPGADFKDGIMKGDQAKFSFAVTLPRRVPIGEKGVGRFGVHKLGDLITLVTKSPDSEKEVVIKIDWRKFDKTTYLSDADFQVTEQTPEVFKNGQTGTCITIGELRKAWDRDLYKELQKSLISLSSPFTEALDFKVIQTLELSDKEKQKNWEETLISLNDISDKAMWKLDCVLEGREFTKFSFEFMPWPAMDKLNKRTLGLSDLPITKLVRSVGRKEEPIDLAQHSIGPIRIQAYLFDLDQKILKFGFQDPRVFKDFMALNGGVKVYRDGLRVYNYGEPDDDWLSLDKTRINEPVKKISNRNVLAAVTLDRRESGDLIEKTNREGFIESKPYLDFKDAINFVIDVFAQQRNRDKEQIRKYYEGGSSSRPVLHDIDDLKDVIEDRLKVVDFEGKKEFSREVTTSLDRIKNQYVDSQKVLLKGAGAGLSLSVVIHEIDKRIKELTTLVESSTIETSRIKNSVRGISKLVDNYSALVASDTKKRASIKQVIEDAIFSSDFRFEAHKVSIVKAFKDSPDVKVSCSVNTVIGMLINLFDNSIYWLSKYEIKDRKIFIDIRKYDDKELGIIVADNGSGLKMDFEEAIQPFITNKPGGIGLGLHIISEMMKTHKGKFVTRSFKETSGIPKEFKDGAILELIFKL
jgi:signal transduction histidine kinase